MIVYFQSVEYTYLPDSLMKSSESLKAALKAFGIGASKNINTTMLELKSQMWCW